MQRMRQKERGFNQADLAGRPLARQLGLPYQEVLLKRERPAPRKNTGYLSMNTARPYVALLQSEKAGGLTIYGSCF